MLNELQSVNGGTEFSAFLFVKMLFYGIFGWRTIDSWLILLPNRNIKSFHIFQPEEVWEGSDVFTFSCRIAGVNDC